MSNMEGNKMKEKEGNNLSGNYSKISSDYVIISKKPDSDKDGSYQKARLVKSGVVQEGNVSFPKTLRRSSNTVGDIFPLLEEQKPKKQIAPKTKKISWTISPEFKDSDSPTGKKIDCEQIFCEIVKCNCVTSKPAKIKKSKKSL